MSDTFSRPEPLGSTLSEADVRLVEHLQTSERQLRLIVDAMPALISYVDRGQRYRFSNRAHATWFGRTAEEMLGLQVAQVLDAATYRAISEHIAAALTGQKVTYETAIPHRDGTLRAVQATYVPDIDRDGMVQGFFSLVDDITDRKRAEDERDVTVQLLRLLNAESDLSAMMRGAIEVLRAWTGCDAVGIRLREGLDFPYFETSGFPAEFVEKERSLCVRDARGELRRDSAGNPVLECMCGNVLCSRFDPTKPFFTPHGSFWTNCTTALLATTSESDRQGRTRNRCNGEGYESVALIPLRTGGVTYGLLQLNDHRRDRFTPERITRLEQLAQSVAIALAENRAREWLQASEARLRLALASSNQGSFELDLVTGRATASDEFARMMGYTPEEFPADVWLERIHPADQEHVRRVYQAVAAGERAEITVKYRIQTRSGEWKWLLSRGKIVARDPAGRPLRVLGTHMDVSERKQTEEALRQTQKTESLGILAGGVAHDFNNLLVALLGQTSLALAMLPQDSAARTPIEKAVNAAQRAADLTRQLLAYSGRGHFAIQRLHLNALIRENLRLLAVALPKHIHLRADLAAALPAIQADAGQIQQVLMNLIINAAEAIGSRPGSVTIQTTAIDVPAAELEAWRGAHEPVSPGAYVMLQVADDGSGMDADTASRIFDPFFTTKATGRGLGLAAVLGIVEGHRGGLRVRSTPGAGTIFELVFPVVVQDEAEPERPIPAPAITTAIERPPTGCILLIDDEAPVREAVIDILEMEGIRVLAAADGMSGLRLYRDHRADVRLVLLDLSMPDMSGEETFRQLRALDPELRVILSSGYDETDVMRRFAGQTRVSFMQKPYSAEMLAREIRPHFRD